MRISFIPPSEHDFKVISSIPLHKGASLDDIFQPRRSSHARGNRRGGGIFSFIAKRVLPFIFEAAKPSAKTFVSSVIKDTIKGKRPTKQSIKKHGIKALKDTGLKLLSGSGKIIKKKKKKKKKKNKKGKTILKHLRKKKKTKSRRGYKKDIFSTV